MSSNDSSDSSSPSVSSAPAKIPFEYGFIPVHVAKNKGLQISFNSSSIQKQFETFLKQFIDSLTDYENEVDENVIREFFMKALKDTYFQEEEKKKQQKEKKSKNAPTGYILFCKDKRPELVEQFPEKSVTELAKEFGAMWKSATKDVKDYYNNQSEEIKKQIKDGTYVFPEKKKRNSSSNSSENATNGKGKSKKSESSNKSEQKSTSTKAEKKSESSSNKSEQKSTSTKAEKKSKSKK
jgi:hypothetical protein